MDEDTGFYLRNKDLLLEIHRSKSSYGQYDRDEYMDYDLIIHPDSFDLPESEDHNIDTLLSKCLLPENIELAKINKAAKLNSQNKGVPKYKKLTQDDINQDDLVFRVLTYHYIPRDEKRKNKPKTLGDIHIKINFIPFIHVIIKDGKTIEVGRSHYKNGEFAPLKGSITNNLARMFMLLVDKYSQRPNWRGYTYINEMKGQALLHLVSMGLKFNEHKSDNPFTYYTQAVSNCFTRVLNEEKMHQDIRDDLLEEHGHNPSLTRQMINDEAMRRHDVQ